MGANFTGVTPAFAREFAAEWVEAWNNHDLDAVLAHYADDFTMSSPLIVRIAGEPTGRLQGKEAVEAYWKAALDKNRDLAFTLLNVTCGADSVALLYESSRAGIAIEYFRFDADGLVTEASAQYDAE